MLVEEAITPMYSTLDWKCFHFGTLIFPYPAPSEGDAEPYIVGIKNSAPSAGSLVGRTSERRWLLDVSWILLSKSVVDS